MFPPFEPDGTWSEEVVEFWACVPHPEREAAIAMADTVIALAPFQVKWLVEVAFYAGGLDATEDRWLLWQSMWQVETETVEIDDVEVEVLMCTTPWMFALAQAFYDGVIPRRPVLRCAQLRPPFVPA